MKKGGVTAQIIKDAHYRTIVFAVLGLIFNLIYAFYNGALGLVTDSIWFHASFVYYILLCCTKFLAVISRKKQSGNKVMITVGILLVILSLVLGVILYISLKNDTAKDYGTIPMIAIAAYTFTKLILAIIKAAKYRKNPSPTLKAIRTIRYSEVAVSMFTLQMSMLKTFGGNDNVVPINALTGTAACMFVFIMGALSAKKGVYGIWQNQKHTKRLKRRRKR